MSGSNGSVETVKLDAFGSGDETAYDIEFLSFEAENRHASFVFEISETQAGLSPASVSPVDGWAAWLEGELVVAFSYREDDAIGCTRVKAQLGATDDDEIDRGMLARAIAMAILTHGSDD